MNGMSMKKINFFIPMKRVPTITHQQKRIKVLNGKPIVYESQDLKNARQLFTAHLSKHTPDVMFNGPIRLIVKWLFPRNKNQSGTYKTTKPDTDNLQKLLKDCMTDVGFWKDDALIASEIIEKFYSDKTGIYIEVIEL